ncbi:hypothetical protein B1748_20010 [Paenibacillus sp. MY03]|jgi:two-component system response regulator YesN|uniref:AraC family transcriptional regulator n=1 Tax=Paenibacillus sp. MY03 TaxID=302980 RepID=UPI000B3CC55D|nr:AraC family transcriptional regulator [Paenibacillus sp. MY03]OUS74869.1 hypothetical protein B1748_20010 [Paenibacillus sp. MY03]
MVCRIVVAEDEPPILRDLIQKIEGMGAGFRVVGQAWDGEEALERVRTLRPDVLLTDIHMPMRSGLSLIEAVKAEFQGIVCVILSGYREFDFAQRALQLGVDDYLVKPVTPEAFERAIRAAKAKADERYDRDMNTALNAFIRRSRIAAEYDPESRRIGLLYVVINHPFRNHPEGSRSRDFMAEAWSNRGLGPILDELREIPEEPAWIIEGNFNNEIIIAFDESGNDPQRMINVWNRLSASAIDRSWYATGASGGSELNAEALSTEIDRLRAISREGAVMGLSRLFKHREPQAQSGWTTADEKSIALLCHNGQTPQLLAAVDRLLERWTSDRVPNVTLERDLVGLLTLVGRSANHIELSQSRNAERLVEDLLSDCGEPDRLRRVIASTIEEAVDANPEPTRTDYEEVVNLVCRYMETHYPNKLTLRELAQQFGLSESHLCKLFKKYKDESPIEYLLKVRIEQSKKLIVENPSFKFKEIAELVGFADQYYYSRVFRSQTGCTPSEYRAISAK